MMKRYTTSLKHLAVGLLVLGGMTGIALAGGGGYSSPPSGQLYSEYKEELSIGQEGAEGSVLYTEQLIDTALGYAWNRWTLRESNPECFDSSNDNFSSDECWSGWAAAAADMTVTVGYDARIYDAGTGAAISSGGTVLPDQRIELVFTPLESDNIYWFATGYSLDSPYGEWREGATAPARVNYENGGIVADHVVCETKDYTSTSHYEYGTNMLLIASGASEPYDISGATGSPYAESLLGTTANVDLSPDGATLYEISTSTIYQFDSGTYGSAYPQAIFITGDSNITGVDWSSDGGTLYATGASGDNIYQYSVPSPFSLVNGASLEDQIPTRDALPQDIQWSSDGSRFYVVGGGSDTIRQYDASSSWEISSASLSSAIDTPGKNPTSIAWDDTGTKFHLSDLRDETIYEFVLSTPWDISTASLSDTLFTGSNIQGLVWSPDGSVLYGAGFVPDSSSYTFDVYNVLVMDPPDRQINTSGLSDCDFAPDGLSAECTVTGTGTINPGFVFESTYGQFYHRYYDSRDMGSYGGPGCYGNNIPVREIIGGEDNPDFTNTYGIPDSGVEPEPYRFTVPQQQITYSLTVEGTENQPPEPPTITGPDSGLAEEEHEFTFSSTDPESDNLRYGIDWNNDDAVDEWIPAGGYVSSGTAQSETHIWFTLGEKTFQALAQDSEGASSGWSSHTFEVVGQPDLQASQLSVDPENPTDGDTVTFDGTITNMGDVSADGTFNNRFEIDLDSSNDAWDVTLDASNSASNLSAGASTEITSPDWTAQEGTHSVRLCADTPDNDISESDENNNCSSPFEFTVVAAPVCSDGVDNDGDGLTDYPNDPDCTGPDDPMEETLPQCSDGLDNDGDGWTDYPNDPGCTDADDDSESPNPPQCSDGIDNDGDGQADYPNDPDCLSSNDDNESPSQCSDGIDNDGDGWTDYPNDPGCTDSGDESEDPNPQCSDGIDNDGDGLIDYPNDPGCEDINDNDEELPDIPNLTSEDLSHDSGDIEEESTLSFSAVVRNNGTESTGTGFTDVFEYRYGSSGGFTQFDTEANSALAAGSTNSDSAAYTVSSGTAGQTLYIQHCIDHGDVIEESDESVADNCEQINLGTVGAPPAPECSDGLDNDGDGLTDYPNDPQCTSASDDDERPRASQCADGLDNDGDGDQNENDSGCHTDCDASNPGSYDSSRDEDETCDVPEGFEGDVDIQGHGGSGNFTDGPVVISTDDEIELQWGASGGPCTLDGEEVDPVGNTSFSLTESHTFVLSCEIDGTPVEDTIRALVFEAEEF